MSTNHAEPARRGRYVHQRWTSFALFMVFWVPLVGIVFDYKPGYETRWTLIMFMAVVAFLMAWPLTFFVDMILQTRADSDGLQSYNSWGIKRKVPWEGITGAKVMNLMPGLKYLSVLDGTGYFTRALIPTFITNQQEFYDDVVEFAGNDHPLAVALRRHGFNGAVP